MDYQTFMPRDHCKVLSKMESHSKILSRKWTWSYLYVKIIDPVSALKIDYWKDKNDNVKVISIIQGGDDGGLHQHDTDGSDERSYKFGYLRT